MILHNYAVRHPQWYKRPDWFLVAGVSRLYDGTDLRSSYFIWQEGVDPFVVVELLSPGTVREHLGANEDLSLDVLDITLPVMQHPNFVSFIQSFCNIRDDSPTQIGLGYLDSFQVDSTQISLVEVCSS